MSTEEKELLLKDLCSRLPYGVKFEHTDKHTLCEILSITPIYDYGNVIYFDDAINHPKKCSIDDVKPYLFPLSSMTRKQREEFVKFADYEPRLENCGKHQELYYYDLVGHENNLYPNSDAIDWLDKNHFDYRGLIPKGLANDCTNLNIY